MKQLIAICILLLLVLSVFLTGCLISENDLQPLPVYCNGVPMKDPQNQSCCNGTALDGSWYDCNGVCIEDGSNQSCCNGTVFDIMTQHCCKDVLQSGGPQTDYYECGDSCYNGKTHSCCGGFRVIEGRSRCCDPTYVSRICPLGEYCCDDEKRGHLCYKPDEGYCQMKITQKPFKISQSS